MPPSLGAQSEEPALLPAYAAEAQWQKRINRSYPYVASQMTSILFDQCCFDPRYFIYGPILIFLVLSALSYTVRTRRTYRNELYYSSSLSRWWRRLHTPPLHPTVHLQPWRLNRKSRPRHVPTRSQTTLISSYALLITLLFLGPPLRLYPPSPPNDPEGFVPTRTTQIFKYYSLRSGSLVFIQLPLMALTGPPARFYADVITSWTGYSRDSINVFHRWLGRIICTHSCMHVFGYVIKNLFLNPRKPGGTVWGGILDGIWRVLWTKTTNLMGVTLFIGMTLLAIPSMKSNRLANLRLPEVAAKLPTLTGYEAFLYLHLLGSILVLVFGVLHLIWTPKYLLTWWIVAYGSIWLIDRISRWAKTRSVDAHARLHSSGIITLKLRLPVDASRTAEILDEWRKPGRVVHLSISGWQNTHPFSIAAASVRSTTPAIIELTLHIRAMQGKDISSYRILYLTTLSQGFTREMWASHNARLVHPTDQRNSAIFDSDDEGIPSTSTPNENRRSRRRDSTISTSSMTHPPAVVRLEGPYGHDSPIFDHDCILLISGGVGVALTIGYLEQILREAMREDVPVETLTSQRVKFVWVVREWSEVQVLRERLERAREGIATINQAHIQRPIERRGLDVEFEVYVTRKPPPVDFTPFSHSSVTGDEVPLPTLKMHTYVRPALSTILREEINFAGEVHMASESKQTSIVVLGCGPAPILDALRVAVWQEEVRRRALQEPDEAIVDVDYYEHGYSW